MYLPTIMLFMILLSAASCHSPLILQTSTQHIALVVAKVELVSWVLKVKAFRFFIVKIDHVIGFFSRTKGFLVEFDSLKTTPRLSSSQNCLPMNHWIPPQINIPSYQFCNYLIFQKIMPNSKFREIITFVQSSSICIASGKHINIAVFCPSKGHHSNNDLITQL